MQNLFYRITQFSLKCLVLGGGGEPNIFIYLLFIYVCCVFLLKFWSFSAIEVFIDSPKTKGKNTMEGSKNILSSLSSWTLSVLPREVGKTYSLEYFMCTLDEILEQKLKRSMLSFVILWLMNQSFDCC